MLVQQFLPDFQGYSTTMDRLQSSDNSEEKKDFTKTETGYRFTDCRLSSVHFCISRLSLINLVLAIAMVVIGHQNLWVIAGTKRLFINYLNSVLTRKGPMIPVPMELLTGCTWLEFVSSSDTVSL